MTFKSKETTNENLNIFKTKPFRFFIKLNKVESNLIKKTNSFENTIKSNDVIIQRPDKGNTMVILIDTPIIKEILNNSGTF